MFDRERLILRLDEVLVGQMFSRYYIDGIINELLAEVSMESYTYSLTNFIVDLTHERPILTLNRVEDEFIGLNTYAVIGKNGQSDLMFAFHFVFQPLTDMIRVLKVY